MKVNNNSYAWEIPLLDSRNILNAFFNNAFQVFIENSKISFPVDTKIDPKKSERFKYYNGYLHNSEEINMKKDQLYSAIEIFPNKKIGVSPNQNQRNNFDELPENHGTRSGKKNFGRSSFQKKRDGAESAINGQHSERILSSSFLPSKKKRPSLTSPRKKFSLLENNIIMLIKSQFLFSQYFISNFNSISSQLYMRRLRILNLKTGIKKVSNINLSQTFLHESVEKSKKTHSEAREIRSKKHGYQSLHLATPSLSERSSLDDLKKNKMSPNFIDYHKRFLEKNKNNLYSIFYTPFLDFCKFRVYPTSFEAHPETPLEYSDKGAPEKTY